MVAFSRVHFAPFVMQRRGERVIFGRADGTDWIDFDAVGAEIIESLDQGLTIEEVQKQVAGASTDAIDVLSFVQELESLGFAAIIDAADACHAPARSSQALKRAYWSWTWYLFALCTGVALSYTVWAFVSRTLALPRVTDLLISGIPLWAALLILACAEIGSVLIHETAHILVARCYGLTPHVKSSRRGIWFVTETDLTGTWALAAHLRWRPILAGLMADANVLAVAVLLIQVTDSHGPVTAVAHACVLLLFTKALWQCQWYLRTDMYFLMAVLSGAVSLRETAWLMLSRLLKRAPGRYAELDTLPHHEIRAAQFYLWSLPLALAATFALWWWILIPFFRELLKATGM